ncbi:MAG TPA: hypothetical protein VGG56_05015 [Terracidiphilus sp.]
MRLNEFVAIFVLAGLIAFMAMTVVIVHFCLVRFNQRRRKQTGRRCSRLSPYALALGMAFLQLVRVFYQPSLAYVLEAKQDEDSDVDDSGDPESPAARLKHFHRQLRRIRRGDPVDRLQLRI